jgi:hypothetical protein
VRPILSKDLRDVKIPKNSASPRLAFPYPSHSVSSCSAKDQIQNPHNLSSMISIAVMQIRVVTIAIPYAESMSYVGA